MLPSDVLMLKFSNESQLAKLHKELPLLCSQQVNWTEPETPVIQILLICHRELSTSRFTESEHTTRTWSYFKFFFSWFCFFLFHVCKIQKKKHKMNEIFLSECIFSRLDFTLYPKKLIREHKGKSLSCSHVGAEFFLLMIQDINQPTAQIWPTFLSFFIIKDLCYW